MEAKALHSGSDARDLARTQLRAGLTTFDEFIQETFLPFASYFEAEIIFSVIGLKISCSDCFYLPRMSAYYCRITSCEIIVYCRLFNCLSGFSTTLQKCL